MIEILFKILTGLGGLSGIAGLVICWLVYRQFDAEKISRATEIEERKNLTRKLDELETEKIVEIKQTLAAHIKDDRSQEILNEIKHLTGSVTRMVDKIDQINRNDAEQRTELKNHDLYFKNLNDLITTHINNHKN